MRCNTSNALNDDHREKVNIFGRCKLPVWSYTIAGIVLIAYKAACQMSTAYT